MNDATDTISAQTEAAADALDALATGPAQESAELIAQAFQRAGSEIEAALTGAAKSGEFSFRAMGQAIAAELSSLALERFVRAPLGNLADALASALPFAGARAEGGPVLPGGAYLVGERGPEVFRPASAGSLGGAGSNVTVNVTLPGVGGVERVSESALARQIARAAAQGMRRL